MTDQELLEHCAAVGLVLTHVSWRDELLTLHPQSVTNLPNAEALVALGEELKRRTNARWVALDIDSVAEVS